MDQPSKVPFPLTTKSLFAAVALNFLIPGGGYLYMGRWIVGILGGLLVAAILMCSPQEHFLLVWMTLNLIMAIDMIVLNSKRPTKH